MNNKKSITTLFLLLILILGVAGLITKGIYYKYETESELIQASSTVNISNQPTETAPFSNTTEEGYSKYTNDVYKFSILYPTSLKRITPGGNLDDLDPKNIFVGEIPPDTLKGSNIGQVHIIAGAKRTDENICKNMIYGNKIDSIDRNNKAENIKINKIQWAKVNFTEGAAGTVYHTTRYSTYKNDICYELLAVSTTPTSSEFNPRSYLTEFEEIVSFFEFTQ